MASAVNEGHTSSGEDVHAQASTTGRRTKSERLHLRGATPTPKAIASRIRVNKLNISRLRKVAKVPVK